MDELLPPEVELPPEDVLEEELQRTGSGVQVPLGPKPPPVPPKAPKPLSSPAEEEEFGVKIQKPLPMGRGGPPPMA